MLKSILITGIALLTLFSAAAWAADDEDSGDVEKGNLYGNTKREKSAAELACTKENNSAGKRVKAGLDDADNEDMGSMLNKARDLNDKVAEAGAASGGQSVNQKDVNKNYDGIGEKKAKQCEQAYKRCIDVASIEKPILDLQAGFGDISPEFGEFAKKRREMAENRDKDKKQCEEFKVNADQARQQAASNRDNVGGNEKSRAGTSVGAGGNPSGGGSAAPQGAGGSAAPKAAAPSSVGGGPVALAAEPEKPAALGNSTLRGASGVVGGFNSDFDGLPPASAAAGGETAKGGKAGASSPATSAAANKFGLQAGRSEMAGSGAGGSGGGGVSGEMRSGGGRTHSDSEIAQAGASARSRAQRALGGMSLKAVDGITGPTGPSLFEKVSSSFQRLTPDLYAAPEDLPPPPPSDP